MLSTPTDADLLAEYPATPGDPAALLARGIALQALGSDELALPPLLAATLLKPTQADGWLQASSTYAMLGYEPEAGHAIAAVRALDPVTGSMWFSSAVEDWLGLQASLSHAVFLASVDRGNQARRLETCEALLVNVTEAHDRSAPVRTHAAVASAYLALAGLHQALDREPEALGDLDRLIHLYRRHPDPRVRVRVAAARVTKGALVRRTDPQAALRNWQDVVTGYGAEPVADAMVARALSNQLSCHAALGAESKLLDVAQTLGSRYEQSSVPDLRRRSAEARLERIDALRRSGRPDEASAEEAALIQAIRQDPAPQIARIADALRVDRSLNRGGKLRRILAAPLRSMVALALHLKHRPVTGIDYAALVPPTRRRAGHLLRWTGRAAQVGCIVLAALALARGVIADDRVSWATLSFTAGAHLGHLISLTGQRLEGRFVAEVLDVVPVRLPRTFLRLGSTLFAAWVSPSLVTAGLAFVYGPPKATYVWLLAHGLPRFVDLAAMVLVAPVEVMLVCGLFSATVTNPVRWLLGADDPLVLALEESFGYVRFNE